MEKCLAGNKQNIGKTTKSSHVYIRTEIIYVLGAPFDGDTSFYSFNTWQNHLFIVSQCN